jgi:hypothetical protein
MIGAERRQEVAMKLRGRARGETKVFAILVGALFLVIAAYLALVLVFVDTIPTVAWVGFGVVVAIAALLSGVAALIVFGTDRPTVEPAERRRPATGEEPIHVLVIANETIGSERLRGEVCLRAGGCESEVLVVVPALNTPIRHWTNDDDDARANARRRLDEEIAALAELGLGARGAVGADDPLQAVDDALRTFPADEIIIATHPEGRSNWLEGDLVGRVRAAYGLPVTHVIAA